MKAGSTAIAVLASLIFVFLVISVPLVIRQHYILSFSHRNEGRVKIVPLPVTNQQDKNRSYQGVKVKAAILYLIELRDPRRLRSLEISLRYLYSNFLCRHSQYPVYLFYEAKDAAYLTQRWMARFRNAVRRARPSHGSFKAGLQQGSMSVLHFYEIAGFDEIPPSVQNMSIPSQFIGRTKNYTMGYRFMCRFWARTVFMQPAVSELEYYWRFDTDSFLLCRVDFDPFVWMKDSSLAYVYGPTQIDDIWYINGLWDVVLDHMSKKNIHPRNLMLLANYRDDRIRTMPLDSALMHLRAIGYSGYSFYNNFELSRTDLWRSEAYADLFRSVDDSGGIFLGRWGDAPIRTIALSALQDAFAEMMSTTEYIAQMPDLCYKHSFEQ